MAHARAKAFSRNPGTYTRHMNREIRRALAIEAAYAEEYENGIAWALHALEEGADSESLRVLASLALEKHRSPWEVDALFRRSLKELGWPSLQRSDIPRQRARELCEDFLSGCLSPRRLTDELDRIAVELVFPPDLSAWAELDACWGLIGLFHPDEAALEEDIRQEARAFIAATPKKFY